MGFWSRAKKFAKKAQKSVRGAVRKAAKGTPFAKSVDALTRMSIKDPSSIKRGFAAGKSILTRTANMTGTVVSAFSAPTPQNLANAASVFGGKSGSKRGGKKRASFVSPKAMKSASTAISKATAGVPPAPPAPKPPPPPAQQAAALGAGALAIKLLLF